MNRSPESCKTEDNETFSYNGVEMKDSVLGVEIHSQEFGKIGFLHRASRANAMQSYLY